MILVTGAAGFIGSAIVWHLNKTGLDNILVSDKFRCQEKWKNLRKRRFFDWIDRDELLEWLSKNHEQVQTIIHMGACSRTTETDVDFLIKNNYEYSKQLWLLAAKYRIRFIYASSAATYGNGKKGYKDDESQVPTLLPLNPYGYSKQLFDRWALQQKRFPPQWVGLKFFNVYGPNEYHKNRMASVVYHAFHQAKTNGRIELFQSHRPDFEDGKQLRDFIYVKDAVKIVHFFVNHPHLSGIFNVGTGVARSFADLAANTMKAMELTPKIQYIPMPEDIREKYQYYTQAEMQKLRTSGYDGAFYSLEDGIFDYVQNYLTKEDSYL